MHTCVCLCLTLGLTQKTRNWTLGVCVCAPLCNVVHGSHVGSCVPSLHDPLLAHDWCLQSHSHLVLWTTHCVCHHVCHTASHVLTDAASHHMDSVAQVVLAGAGRREGMSRKRQRWSDKVTNSHTPGAIRQLCYSHACVCVCLLLLRTLVPDSEDPPSLSVEHSQGKKDLTHLAKPPKVCNSVLAHTHTRLNNSNTVLSCSV